MSICKEIFWAIVGTKRVIAGYSVGLYEVGDTNNFNLTAMLTIRWAQTRYDTTIQMPRSHLNTRLPA